MPELNIDETCSTLIFSVCGLPSSEPREELFCEAGVAHRLGELGLEQLCFGEPDWGGPAHGLLI